MMLDSRQFSQEAHQALTELKIKLDSKYHDNASNLIRGLTAYISTWGLHRLSGDAKKFLKGTGSDTRYKGVVYQKFLERLKSISNVDFKVDDEGSLVNLTPLRKYTALNHLAIQLAKEWSFWAPAVLGEAKSAVPEEVKEG